MKPLLVGECNPYGSEPYFALYPYPVNSAGWRLCRLVLGISRHRYLREFDRANLCAGRKWDLAEARGRATELLAGARPANFASAARRTYVLLGKRVCDAFGVPFRPFTSTRPGILVLPHPSGRSRGWHGVESWERARRLLIAAGALSGE